MKQKEMMRAVAGKLGCKPADFLAYRFLDGDEGISVIAPSGQKFVYLAGELENLADSNSSVLGTDEYTLSQTRSELVAACRERGLSTTGAKAVLLDRLNG